MPGRPDWDEWAFGIVDAVSKRGDCTRRQVGALILGPDHRVFGLGYNGSYPGGPSCLAGDCPRGRHYKVEVEPGAYDIPRDDCSGDDKDWLKCGCTYPDDGMCRIRRERMHVKKALGSDGFEWAYACACGNRWPCPDAVAPGSSYDTGPGACVASHAESNAISDAMQRNGGRLRGCVMYVSCEPCEGCLRHIRNSTDIRTVIWPDGVTAFPFDTVGE